MRLTSSLLTQARILLRDRMPAETTSSDSPGANEAGCGSVHGTRLVDSENDPMSEPTENALRLAELLGVEMAKAGAERWELLGVADRALVEDLRREIAALRVQLGILRPVIRSLRKVGTL